MNILELYKRWEATTILLFTSNVYSLAALSALPVRAVNRAYEPDFNAIEGKGLSEA